MAQLMIDTATMAFRLGSKVMIEAQQRVIDCDPSRQPMPATAGTGRSRCSPA